MIQHSGLEYLSKSKEVAFKKGWKEYGQCPCLKGNKRNINPFDWFLSIDVTAFLSQGHQKKQSMMWNKIRRHLYFWQAIKHPHQWNNLSFCSPNILYTPILSYLDYDDTLFTYLLTVSSFKIGTSVNVVLVPQTLSFFLTCCWYLNHL